MFPQHLAHSLNLQLYVPAPRRARADARRSRGRELNGRGTGRLFACPGLTGSVPAPRVRRRRGRPGRSGAPQAARAGAGARGHARPAWPQGVCAPDPSAPRSPSGRRPCTPPRERRYGWRRSGSRAGRPPRAAPTGRRPPPPRG